MDKSHWNAIQDRAALRRFVNALLLAGVAASVGLASARAADDDEIAARVAPVGTLNTSGEAIAVPSTATEATPVVSAPTAAASAPTAAEPAAAAASTADSGGEAIYGRTCVACHGAGIAGAPKVGDADAWSTRVAQGTETLYKHAIEGFQGATGVMPPRGGAADLSDEQVKGAVDFMLAQLDATAAAVTPAAAAAAPAAAAPAADSQAKGKEVYVGVCFVCHETGAAGAPKLGDAAAWGERVAQGNDVLYDHAINGYMGKTGMMPPKGGRPDLADEDVKAAVDYMVDNSK